MSSDEDRDMTILRQHAAALSEHFDSVQIFITRFHPEGGTTNATFGQGNWYARFGQVKVWSLREEERERALIRREEEGTTEEA